MWSIAGIVLTGVFIALFEAPYLIKKRMTKELCIFIGFLFLGVALSILQVLRVPIPNPLDVIAFIHKPISKFMLGMLE